jgi:hypothetical protein
MQAPHRCSSESLFGRYFSWAEHTQESTEIERPVMMASLILRLSM